MSQADVDLVRSLSLDPGVDWAAIVRDDALSEMVAEQTAHLRSASFRCALAAVTTTWYTGFEGLRKVWLDWLEPWTTYRSEEEAIVDLGGGRVLYLARDFGGRPDGREVELRSAAIWTINEGEVAEITFFASREDALEAAGLAGAEAQAIGQRHGWRTAEADS